MEDKSCLLNASCLTALNVQVRMVCSVRHGRNEAGSCFPVTRHRKGIRELPRDRRLLHSGSETRTHRNRCYPVGDMCNVETAEGLESPTQILLSSFLFGFIKSGEFFHSYVLPPFCYPAFRANTLPTEPSLRPEITFSFALISGLWKFFIAGYSYPGLFSCSSKGP